MASSPHGTQVDLNILQKQLGMLKMYLGRNAMSAAKTLSALIVSELGTINTAIQAASTNTGLSADATLALRFDYTPDPGVANSDGTAGATNVTITDA